MIRTDEGLRRTREALGHLEEALHDLTAKKDQYHPTTFAVMARPIIDDIQMYRAEIDAYIGLGRKPDRRRTSGRSGKPLLPSLKETLDLPRRAQAAYLVRCARRVAALDPSESTNFFLALAERIVAGLDTRPIWQPLFTPRLSEARTALAQSDEVDGTSGEMVAAWDDVWTRFWTDPSWNNRPVDEEDALAVWRRAWDSAREAGWAVHRLSSDTRINRTEETRLYENLLRRIEVSHLGLAFRPTSTDPPRRGPAAESAHRAAEAALTVAREALRWARGYQKENAEWVIEPLVRAVDATELAIVRAAKYGDPIGRQLRLFRKDFDRLAALATENHWTDDTPVPPDVFGSLWPAKARPAWAAEEPPAERPIAGTGS